MNLPRALSSIPDALNALARLSKVFHAPLMDGNAIEVDTEQVPALVVEGAVFQWESVPVPKEDKKKDKTAKAAKKPAEPEKPVQEARVPFKVEVPKMIVPRGSLVAIVGPVGSGKVRVTSDGPA